MGSKKVKATTEMSPGRRVNKIQKQLEYYFSSQNMDSDTFLRESMDNNGWVHIDVITAFNRMNVLGATKELVVEAAFHSKQSVQEEYLGQIAFSFLRRRALDFWPMRPPPH